MPTVTLSLPETTFISVAQPSTNFSVYPLMYAGTDPSFYGCTSLINVALPTLPKSVVSAMLQLSVIVKSGASPSTVAVSQLSAAFNAKTVTYSSMPSLISTATKFSVSINDLYTSIHADITDVVNAWLSGAAVNHGIALTVSDGTVVQFGTNNIVYEPYFPKLIITYSDTPVPTGQPYGYIYNTDSQSVARENPIQFTDSGPMDQITHDDGSESVVIQSAGLYAVWYRVTGTSANQFAVFQNEAVLLNSVYGTPVANNTGMTMVNAAENDVITLRNHTSSGSVTLDTWVGGDTFGVSASLTLLKIGPNVAPNPILTAVNAAETPAEMLSAIQDPALNLYLIDFNQLTASQQQDAVGVLLSGRPTLGYLTVPDAQMMVDYAVNWAETHTPNLKSIYVKAGATGGNGSFALPFGDIQTGIDAVLSDGTVHVLPGNYLINQAILVDKANIQVAGEGNPQIVRQMATPCVIISGANSIVSGLTLTGTTAGQMRLIEILIDNVSIMYNTIFDPGKGGTSTGVSTIGNRTGVAITGNTFYNLMRGILINSDCTASSIRNNHIYNCSMEGIFLKGGFTVTGNSWDPAGSNVEDDIGIRSGNYVVADLSAANNGARVTDDRS